MRLVRQKYYTANGEAKINCYKIAIGKKYILEAGINEKDDLEVYAEKNKIIVRKRRTNEKKKTKKVG